MRRKLFKTGNSIVVSLPKDIIEPLGVSEGMEVSVDLDRENMQIIDIHRIQNLTFTPICEGINLQKLSIYF